MSVSPIAGAVTAAPVQQPAGVQTASTTAATAVSPAAGAAQSWESALLAALGDGQSVTGSTADPLAAATGSTADPLAAATGSAADPSAGTTSTSTDPLSAGLGSSASLLSMLDGGSSSGSAASPLLTSLSDPATTAVSSTDAGLATDGLNSLI